MKILVTLIAMTLLLVACVDDSPTKEQIDPGVLATCDRAFELVTDVNDGLLTWEELRVEFKDVVRRSRDTAVADEAREMMTAINETRSDLLDSKGVALARACSDALERQS